MNIKMCVSLRQEIGTYIRMHLWVLGFSTHGNHLPYQSHGQCNSSCYAFDLIFGNKLTVPMFSLCLFSNYRVSQPNVCRITWSGICETNGSKWFALTDSIYQENNTYAIILVEPQRSCSLNFVNPFGPLTYCYSHVSDFLCYTSAIDK